MSNPLQQTIEALAKEKGIEPDVVISAIEEAVATASRKYYKTGENLKTRFNTETGQVDLFALKQVVQEVTNPAIEIAIDEARQIYQQLYGDDVANSIELGDEMEFPKPTEVLGRIAAQTAKQVIFQKVREAERENIFAEYNQRIGEVVNGTVKRFENGDIILEVGRIEAVLPRKEQSRAESYSPADRVRTVIKGVNRSAKGPQIVLSRTDPALLIKLFEQEVPEIYDGTVMIRGAVREAGRPREGRRVLARARRRSGRRVRRHEGHARAVDHPRAARREDRHRRMVGGPDRVCHQRAQPGEGPARLDRRRPRARDGGRSSRTSSCRSRSARRARTSGSPPSSRAGGSTSRAKRKSAARSKRSSRASRARRRRRPAAEASEAPTSAPERPRRLRPRRKRPEAPTAGPEASDAAGDAAPGESADAPLPYTLAGVGDKTVRKLVEAGYATVEAVAAASVEQLSEIPGVGDKTAEKILASARGEATPEATE